MGNILGKYYGKCCDGDVVNNNGMYLSRELFDTVISSDEYKTAIKNRYYIGFLGHPEDPNCMDFKDACIVMTDMYMEDNGDIIGSFDLVDTPVGRVVKAFKDAGVNFGISIRGAGDVASDGTVDPESFVFRGFDLVTFPAYNDCVPEFQEIAASSDVVKQNKYRKVCAAVRNNLSNITSCEAVNVIRDQFNPNSEEYRMLDERSKQLSQDVDPDLYVKVLEQKVQGLTKAYVNKVRECNSHKHQVSIMNDKLCKQRELTDKVNRRAEFACDQSVRASNTIRTLRRRNGEVSSQLKSVKASSNMMSHELDKIRKENVKLKQEKANLVEASTKLKENVNSLTAEHNTALNKNLLSDKKVEASKALLKDKDASIKELESELRKTVAENDKLKQDVSNRGAEIEELVSKVEACEQLIFDYQQACADSFAYEVGVNLENVPVTSSTTVDELRSYIYDRASSSQHPYKRCEDVDTEDENDTFEGPVTV